MQETAEVSQAGVTWTLVRGTDGADEQHIQVVPPFPFSIGRRPGCSLQLNYKTISGTHAELRLEGEQLWVSDLNSTNGTYVNGRRINARVPLREEDLLQFADMAFRVRSESRQNTCLTMAEDVCDQALALVQFDRLMENRLVTPYFQPIVDMATGAFRGYEILARSRLFGLESCSAMFDAAARLNMEVELSRMLRWEGVREGLNLNGNATLFVNTHPLEIRREGLIASMGAARQLSQDVPIILEVHEAAITDPREMQLLRSQLKELNIGLAYDDFGAGQTRLSELVEAPPDYLKFDISLIHEIDRATPERQKMLASLVQIVLELGVNPLAEGVETEAEAEVCRNMGFLTAQGFYFGRPAPVRDYQL
ncbi:Putative cyclic-di-GMP phosphodiesterase AdrB [Aureliella helgolandensis]|uniref:Cyclic-di-GMP phosphodiesterase AdrB n=1 Tax=Aureliella helgolandensis TaxID=2527968 RepID=A0A518G518_9BACT|nr:Putative cyclic-di-GMP phosphodiesterase AdrB [Aureliella helgolandensis]